MPEVRYVLSFSRPVQQVQHNFQFRGGLNAHGETHTILLILIIRRQFGSLVQSRRCYNVSTVKVLVGLMVWPRIDAKPFNVAKKREDKRDLATLPKLRSFFSLLHTLAS